MADVSKFKIGTIIYNIKDAVARKVMKGAETNAAGEAGQVPAPGAGAANRYLRSDGSWQVPPDTNTTYGNMTAATANAAGRAGLVPAPGAGAQGKYLRGDGTWQTPPDTNTVYTHPSTHPASMISQDASHRFVTDTEKTAWNGKVNTSDIINNCTSTATNKPLSAAQGKALWDKYTQLNGDKVAKSENPLYFRGTITGNLNRTDISPGYYVIGAPGTISNGVVGTSDSYSLFIQFGDNYKTQMIVDGSGPHSRSYIGSPAAWLAWSDNTSNGNGTINTTYVTKSNTTFVHWKKYGRMVTVELYDVDTKAGYSTENVMTLATGLPAPYGGEIMACLTGHDKSANKAVQVRLRVDSAGVLKPWYIGTSTVTTITGSFSYIA